MPLFDFDGLFGILILIGLVTGLLTGLTGASGMSVLISALLLAGIEIRQIIGLTFVITLVNALIAVGSYWKHGHLDVRSGVLVAIPAIGAVLVGHTFSRSVETDWLTGLMLVCLFAIGVKFLASREDAERNLEKQDQTAHSIGNLWALVTLGSIAGFIMGVMGGGGAVFISIALIIGFKMETKTAIGTSILIMGLAAIPGVLSHWRSETIHASYAVAILASSIPSAFAASWFANKISQRRVKQLLGVYLVSISTLLVFRTFV